MLRHDPYGTGREEENTTVRDVASRSPLGGIRTALEPPHSVPAGSSFLGGGLTLKYILLGLENGNQRTGHKGPRAQGAPPLLAEAMNPKQSLSCSFADPVFPVTWLKSPRCPCSESTHSRSPRKTSSKKQTMWTRVLHRSDCSLQLH